MSVESALGRTEDCKFQVEINLRMWPFKVCSPGGNLQGFSTCCYRLFGLGLERVVVYMEIGFLESILRPNLKLKGTFSWTCK